MKKFLLVTLISSFIIACGGGDGGSASAGNEPQTLTQAQIEEKFNLPPEPTADMVGFDTIEGIDSNGIRGRDDVERKIAFEFYKAEKKMNQLHNMAKVHLDRTAAYKNSNSDSLDKNIQEYSKLNMCYVLSYKEKGGIDLRKLDRFIENTSDRRLHALSVKGERSGSFKDLIDYCKSIGFSIEFN